MITAALRALLARNPFPALRRGASAECTGIAASWCPVCGDCSCVYLDDELPDGRRAEDVAEDRYGWLIHNSNGFRFRQWGIVESKLRINGQTFTWLGSAWRDPDCPLHGDDSSHAERPDLFEVLDEVAGDLEAAGVRVSLDDFRRNLAAYEDP